MRIILWQFRGTKERFRRREKTMCDYSLMAIPNRLAEEGEDLVTHRFSTGSLGLASPLDLPRVTNPVRAQTRREFRSSLKDFMNPRELKPVPAVCVPPGARLILQDIPEIGRASCRERGSVSVRA